MKSYSIGRDAGCDIVLNDNTDVISRRHAVLTVASSGKMTITDLSTNGTYINGQRISSNVAVPVTRKDSVSFAHVSTLDWNIIPKSNQWLRYVIGGLAAAAVIDLRFDAFRQLEDTFLIILINRRFRRYGKQQEHKDKDHEQ